MIIRTLQELQAPDERTQRVTPFGLGMSRMLTPEASVAYQHHVLSGTDLVAAVPDGIRLGFDRVRTTFVYGALNYDLFTVAESLARLETEHALRGRFLTHYNHSILFVNSRGEERQETVDSYEDVMNVLKRSDMRPRKGRTDWLLALPTSGSRMKFNGMLANLWTWARTEGLLPGQWARRLQRPQVDLRNTVAHPSGHHLSSPIEAARAIRDLAEIINCLWGTRTPGGRLHPAPLRRAVLAISWDADRTEICDITALPLTRVGAGATTIVVRAVPDDPRNLWQFDARFDTTRYPADLLWGPGPPADALTWFEDHRPAEDEVDHLDRHFLIRHHADRVEPPRRPGIAAGLTGKDRDGVWHVVRADEPESACHHVQQLVAANPDCVDNGPCGSCAAESISKGSWQDALNLLRTAGVDVQPQYVEDVHVPSPLPRWGA
jgi:hypothetical protein